MTAGTTLLALLPLVFMGGTTLINFSAALTWGIFVGTFSSIYVAAALLIYMPPLRRVEFEIKYGQSLQEERLVLATHNQGKLREFKNVLGASFGSIVTAGDLGLPEPEETVCIFVENALIKAQHSAGSWCKSATLADDSGFCVTASGGDPGLYSARWAGPNKDFRHAMQTVNDKLGDAADRSAYFIAVLAFFVLPDGREEIFESRVDGHIGWAAKTR